MRQAKIVVTSVDMRTTAIGIASFFVFHTCKIYRGNIENRFRRAEAHARAARNIAVRAVIFNNFVKVGKRAAARKRLYKHQLSQFPRYPKHPEHGGQKFCKSVGKPRSLKQFAHHKNCGKAGNKRNCKVDCFLYAGGKLVVNFTFLYIANAENYYKNYGNYQRHILLPKV